MLHPEFEAGHRLEGRAFGEGQAQLPQKETLLEEDMRGANKYEGADYSAAESKKEGEAEIKEPYTALERIE